MTVSVIVPNYNHEHFLVRRLESVLQQDYSDMEVIILDDHSTDNSRNVIETFRNNPRVKQVIYNDVNSGSAFSQWEKGIGLATGRYLWIAESDDYCDKNFLTEAVKKLDSGYDLFYSRSVRIDEKDHVMENQGRWYEDISKDRWLKSYENSAPDEVKDVLFRKCVINNASAVVFKNEPRIKGYLSRIRGMFYAGDWWFWIMYLLDSRKLYYSADTTNYFRTHAGVTRLRQPERRNSEMLRIFRFIFNHPLSQGNRKALAAYFFDIHIYKGSRRQLGRNCVLAFRMILCSRFFIRPWLRFYFS